MISFAYLHTLIFSSPFVLSLFCRPLCLAVIPLSFLTLLHRTPTCCETQEYHNYQGKVSLADRLSVCLSLSLSLCLKRERDEACLRVCSALFLPPLSFVKTVLCCVCGYINVILTATPTPIPYFLPPLADQRLTRQSSPSSPRSVALSFIRPSSARSHLLSLSRFLSTGCCFA